MLRFVQFWNFLVSSYLILLSLNWLNNNSRFRDGLSVNLLLSFSPTGDLTITGSHFWLNDAIESWKIYLINKCQMNWRIDDELILWYGWPTKGVQPYFQSGPLSGNLTIANLQHAASKIWICAKPGFRLCWMKLCTPYQVIFS